MSYELRFRDENGREHVVQRPALWASDFYGIWHRYAGENLAECGEETFDPDTPPENARVCSHLNCAIVG